MKTPVGIGCGMQEVKCGMLARNACDWLTGNHVTTPFSHFTTRDIATHCEYATIVW